MFGRALALAAVCGLSFVAAAALLRPWVPPPEDDDLAARFSWFAEHRDEFDLVFIGSSNVLLGIDPKHVDQGLAERGHPVRSFSFGARGMNASEGRYLLDEVLALEPGRLRWVVIEMVYVRATELIGANPWQDRVVAWHDFPRTSEVIESIRRARVSTRERIDLAQRHLRHMAWRYSNIGQGPGMATALLGLDAADLEKAHEKIATNRGFKPLGIFRHEQSPRARARLERDWKQRMDRFASTQRTGAPSEIFNAAPILRQVERLEALGIEPIYVIAPVGRGTPLLERLVRAGTLPEALIYNRPKRFPELYDVDHRHDVTHLNARGAKIWSAMLAEDIADRMDARRDEAARR